MESVEETSTLFHLFKADVSTGGCLSLFTRTMVQKVSARCFVIEHLYAKWANKVAQIRERFARNAGERCRYIQNENYWKFYRSTNLWEVFGLSKSLPYWVASSYYKKKLLMLRMNFSQLIYQNLLIMMIIVWGNFLNLLSSKCLIQYFPDVVERLFLEIRSLVEI